MSLVSIFYGTRQGMSRKTAQVLKRTFEEKHDLSTSLYDLRSKVSVPPLDSLDNIVVGSGIASGKWTKEVLGFLKNDFRGKKVAVYVCSSNAGAEHEKGNKEGYLHFHDLYITQIVAEHLNVEPVSTRAFGGQVRYFRITFVKNWSSEEVVGWADELASFFGS